MAHGEDFQEAAWYCYNLNPSQLVAVGVNCTDPIYSESLFRDINKGNETNPIPLIIYPNSGEKYLEGVGLVPETVKNKQMLSVFLGGWVRKTAGP